MECQLIFSENKKKKKKNLECCLRQILLGALRVNVGRVYGVYVTCILGLLNN